MGSEFTFYDYFDADGSKVNVINTWLNGDGKPAKAFFTHLIENLEASQPPGSDDTVWKEPYTELLKREWRGFIALRKTGKVQYRLICRMNNRDVHLVAYGIHKAPHYETDVTPDTALKRAEQMRNDPVRYRREHDVG